MTGDAIALALNTFVPQLTGSTLRIESLIAGIFQKLGQRDLCLLNVHFVPSPHIPTLTVGRHQLGFDGMGEQIIGEPLGGGFVSERADSPHEFVLAVGGSGVGSNRCRGTRCTSKVRIWHAHVARKSIRNTGSRSGKQENCASVRAKLALNAEETAFLPR